ncbi:hypothetical protein MTO96_020071 [Rhipicephalus appendiculatus]
MEVSARRNDKPWLTTISSSMEKYPEAWKWANAFNMFARLLLGIRCAWICAGRINNLDDIAVGILSSLLLVVFIITNCFTGVVLHLCTCYTTSAAPMHHYGAAALHGTIIFVARSSWMPFELQTVRQESRSFAVDQSLFAAAESELQGSGVDITLKPPKLRFDAKDHQKLKAKLHNILGKDGNRNDEEPKKGVVELSTIPQPGTEPSTYTVEVKASRGLEEIAELLIQYLSASPPASPNPSGGDALGTIIISTNPMPGDEPGTFALEARVSKGLEDVAGLLIRYLVGLLSKNENTELDSACKNAEGPGRQDSPPPPTPPPPSPVAVTITNTAPSVTFDVSDGKKFSKKLEKLIGQTSAEPIESNNGKLVLSVLPAKDPATQLGSLEVRHSDGLEPLALLLLKYIIQILVGGFVTFQV